LVEQPHKGSVVGFQSKFSSKQVVAVSLECPDDGKKFEFGGTVISLVLVRSYTSVADDAFLEDSFSFVVGDGKFLAEYSSEASLAGIRLKDERFGEIGAV
jgi:hypothetical protein